MSSRLDEIQLRDVTMADDADVRVRLEPEDGEGRSEMCCRGIGETTHAQ